MNNIKRILSLVLVLALAAALMVPAFAAELTITGMNDGNSHQFNAYQIFGGDLVETKHTVGEGPDAKTIYRAPDGTMIYNNGTKWMIYDAEKAPAEHVEYDKSVKVEEMDEWVEHVLSNVQWGTGLSNEGKVAMYNKYVGNVKIKEGIEDAANAPHTVVAFRAIGGAYTYMELKDGTLAAMPAGLTATVDDTWDDYEAYITGNDGMGDIADGKRPAAQVAEKIRGLNSGNTRALADFLSENDYLATAATATGNASATFTDLEQGYYLVKQVGAGDGEASSRYMLRVLGDISVATKASAPVLMKKVKENSALSAGTPNKDDTMSDITLVEGWNDVADYSVGEEIEFALFATMPSTYTDYKTYKVVFHDKPSAGITLSDNHNDYKLHIRHTDSSAEEISISASEGNIKLDVTADGMTLTILDTKKISGLNAGSVLRLTFKGKLNSNAVIGGNGNLNTAYLEFSNDPNWYGDPTKDVVPTGKTPEDSVVVFTYELDVTKQAAEQAGTTGGTKLPGAVFKLMSETSKKWAVANLVTNDDGSQTYKVTNWVDTEAGATELTSMAGGKLPIVGLDDGHYDLKEIKAPVGYNLLTKPVHFAIDAVTANSQSYKPDSTKPLTKLELKVLDGEVEHTTVEGNIVNGAVGMTVYNQAGNQLPVTGGMGTTLFYILGAVLALGAGILLVVRRRME